MLRRLAWSMLLTAAVWAAWPPAAGASCASMVVVDGHRLIGWGLDGRAARAALPATVGARPAVVPACNDSSAPEVPDTRAQVLTLAGIPSQVAVLDRSRETLYVDFESLVQLEQHPLHAAAYGPGGATLPRAGSGCRPQREPLTATLVELESTGRGFRADVGGRERSVGIHRETRIANRPAYTPLRAGQKLRLRTSRCGARRVADEIAFAGPVPGEATVTDGIDVIEDDGLDVFVIPAVLLGAALLLIVVIGVALLGPRRRT